MMYIPLQPELRVRLASRRTLYDCTYHVVLRMDRLHPEAAGWASWSCLPIFDLLPIDQLRRRIAGTVQQCAGVDPHGAIKFRVAQQTRHAIERTPTMAVSVDLPSCPVRAVECKYSPKFAHAVVVSGPAALSSVSHRTSYSLSSSMASVIRRHNRDRPRDAP